MCEICCGGLRRQEAVRRFRLGRQTTVSCDTVFGQNFWLNFIEVEDRSVGKTVVAVIMRS